MTLSEDTLEDVVTGVGVATTCKGLAAIAEPECGAAIWLRPQQPRFASWLDALSPDQLPRARVVLQPDRVQDALGQIFDISGMPGCKERDALIRDACTLAKVFAGIMNVPYLRMRLDLVTTNACRKFHRDAVTARLVCTYRGTGTQYGVSNAGEDPEQILTTPTGSPIVLRGSLWPESPNSGLLHRSPPIEGTGETRSVMVLDPVFDLEDAD